MISVEQVSMCRHTLLQCIMSIVRGSLSSIEQREGRGIRQGNENEEVAIYRYVTKGTFDAYNWSLVENKQRFISQVMTSKAVSPKLRGYRRGYTFLCRDQGGCYR